MKNTICEKLMWSAMTPTMFRYISKNCGEVDVPVVKKTAHKNYKAMVGRTPDIGSFMKNTLRVSLAGGIVWLSVYDAMNGHMSHEQFGEMVRVTRQEHHEDLIPYMCEMDFISVDLMGGVLHRTGTIATGAEMCDFYVYKKGSEWDK